MRRWRNGARDAAEDNQDQEPNVTVLIEDIDGDEEPPKRASGTAVLGHPEPKGTAAGPSGCAAFSPTRLAAPVPTQNGRRRSPCGSP